MQSDLLQQAIVDATALKEAAIKNAENTLIEKYSHEFEQTVQKLLEQEAVATAPAATPAAPPTGDASAAPDATAAAPDMSAMSADGSADKAGDKAFKNVPSSFLDGDEDEKIVINFDQIKQTMMEMFDIGDNLLETDMASAGETVLQDAVAPGAPKKAGMNQLDEEELEEEIELDESWDEEQQDESLELEQESIEALELDEEMLQEMNPETVKSLEDKAANAETRAANLAKPASTADADAKKIRADAKKAAGELQAQELATQTEPVAEDVEITEEELMELAEQLKVDINVEAQGRGYMGSTTTEKRLQRETELAASRDDKAAEKRQEELEEMGDLVKENKTLASTNKELVSTLQELKVQFEKMNLSNAKLLYTNKALGNISLNERQKSQIVESISKADSVLAAKTIYETLQNAVESTKKEKETPQSLREALNRAQTPFVVKKTATNSINDIMAERMKALAGIKSNK